MKNVHPCVGLRICFDIKRFTYYDLRFTKILDGLAFVFMLIKETELTNLADFLVHRISQSEAIINRIKYKVQSITSC